MKIIERLKYLSYGERLRELGPSRLEKNLKGILSIVYQYL